MAVQKPFIYFDHAATTPVRPEVLAAMQPYFAEYYGNPSSIHGVGRRGHHGVETARRALAELIGARPTEIIFTAGGTESDNGALRGMALARRRLSGANRIVTTPIEHKAVLETAYDLRDHFGFALTLLPVDGTGLVDVAHVVDALDEDVALVSVMYANNEVGTVEPIAAIGAACRARGIPLHTDAVQAAGKCSLDVELLQVDALSVSAHKVYGPKGVGFLYLRSGTPYQPIFTGGSHEAGRRAGTENVPGVVGMARALALAESERADETERLHALRERLIDGVLTEIEGAILTGHRRQRLANHASFLFPGLEAEGLLIGLDLAGIAASSGSACTSAAQQPSHVLSALGFAPVDAVGGLRLSLGRSTRVDQVDALLAVLPALVARLAAAVPVPL